MYSFSPRPITDYFVPGLNGSCEAGAIASFGQPKSVAVWNMFWLSVPQIDNLLDADSNWFRNYTPIKGASVAISTDVLLDEAMYRKLLMHPVRFASWFRECDYTVYESYELFGEKTWVDTVLRRASEAAHAIAMADPYIAANPNVIDLVTYRASKAA